MGLNTHQYKSIPMEYVINLITHQSINWLIILSLLIIPKVYSSPMDTIDFVNDSPNQFNRHPKDATGFNRSLASSSSNSHHHQQYFRVRPRSNVEVIEGSSISLQCQVGNQAGAVQWAKDGFVLGFDRSIPGYPRYSMEGNPIKGEHNLQIENASIDDDGEYQCQVGPASNNKAIRANSRLTVLLKPKKIEIIGHSNGSAVEVREGEKVTLTCLVYGGKPSAKIKWFRRETELNSTSLPNQSVLTVTSSTNDGVSSSNGGGDSITTTRSELSLKLNAEDNGITYTCSASHPALSSPLRSTVSMSVLYPPSAPEISGYHTGDIIRKGDTLKLRCRSRGGNPLAQLIWYKNDEPIDFSFDSHSNRESINEYTFEVDSDDNNAKFTCEAKTPISSNAMTTSVTLSVQFAPSSVTIVGLSEAKAGDNVTLICKTEPSNPPAELNWSIDGRTIKTENSHKSQSKGGGYITTTNITVPILSTERSVKTFSCFAINRALDTTVTATHALNILFKPEFGSESMVSFELVEGNEASINLTARGNPANIKYKWHRISGNNGLDSTRFITEGPVFNITSVLRQDSGSYLIEATNSQGTTKLPFTLNVKYAATITQKSDLALVDIGKTAYLECTVDANPITKDLIKWQRKPNYVEDSLESFTTLPTFDSDSVTMSDNERFKITILDNRSFLSVFNVSESDSGAYECLASNGIGSPDSATTNLIVKHQPRILMAPILSKSASDNGSKGRLVCRAQGAPNITFQWFREGAIISEKMTNNKYTVEPIEQPNLITYQSTLVINDVTNKDYGPYECIARNELGLNRLSIHFNRTSPPDPPLTLKIVNRTTSSITLRWIPGFDGGLSQSFRLRYQKIDTKSSDDSNTVISSSTSSPSDNSLSSLSSTTSSVVSSEPAQYSDVHPSNTTIFTIKGLTDNSEYSFNVMAYNDLGESKYNMDNIRGKTLQETPVSETERISQVFSGQSGDVPRLIIIAVSVLGSTLLLLNVVLVICFVRKRRKKRLEEETDGSSTNKPATIEMYAPASGSGGSYTNGPNETSLSASDEEKHSEGAYSGQTDYVMEINSGIPMNGNQQSIHPNIHSYMHGNIHQSLTTYLIDDPLENVKNYYQPQGFSTYVPLSDGYILASLPDPIIC
ncbi:nephrin-like isoform X2 [Panonychus citri]|uniref:nephrin-like isoform X2 n=1 Tax=Panonychus citri TaxID=50023 RepID=UPI0023081DB3|nr:nephrin-like isoform X2 [Panonychus citri]